jgi:hypothetical protein
MVATVAERGAHRPAQRARRAAPVPRYSPGTLVLRQDHAQRHVDRRVPGCGREAPAGGLHTRPAPGRQPRLHHEVLLRCRVHGNYGKQPRRDAPGAQQRCEQVGVTGADAEAAPQRRERILIAQRPDRDRAALEGLGGARDGRRRGPRRRQRSRRGNDLRRAGLDRGRGRAPAGVVVQREVSRQDRRPLRQHDLLLPVHKEQSVLRLGRELHVHGSVAALLEQPEREDAVRGLCAQRQPQRRLVLLDGRNGESQP